MGKPNFGTAQSATTTLPKNQKVTTKKGCLPATVTGLVIKKGIIGLLTVSARLVSIEPHGKTFAVVLQLHHY